MANILATVCLNIHHIYFRHLTHPSSLYMDVSGTRTVFLLESPPTLWITLLGNYLLLWSAIHLCVTFLRILKRINRKQPVTLVLLLLSRPCFRYSVLFTTL